MLVHPNPPEYMVLGVNVGAFKFPKYIVYILFWTLVHPNLLKDMVYISQ